MSLLALALATVATPMFGQGASEGKGNAPENLLQAIQLYASVLAITFAALFLVFFALWVLGWLYVLVHVAFRLVLSWIGLGSV